MEIKQQATTMVWDVSLAFSRPVLMMVATEEKRALFPYFGFGNII